METYEWECPFLHRVIELSQCEDFNHVVNRWKKNDEGIPDEDIPLLRATCRRCIHGKPQTTEEFEYSQKTDLMTGLKGCPGRDLGM